MLVADCEFGGSGDADFGDAPAGGARPEPDRSGRGLYFVVCRGCLGVCGFAVWAGGAGSGLGPRRRPGGPAAFGPGRRRVSACASSRVTIRFSQRLAELRARSNNPRLWPPPWPRFQQREVEGRAGRVAAVAVAFAEAGASGLAPNGDILAASPASVGFDRSGTLCIVRVSSSLACLPLSAPVGHGGVRRGLAHWKGYMDCTAENGVAALVRRRHHPATAGASQTAPRAAIGIY